jgi:hypothetical protein
MTMAGMPCAGKPQILLVSRVILFSGSRLGLAISTIGMIPTSPTASRNIYGRIIEGAARLRLQNFKPSSPGLTGRSSIPER